MAIIKKNTLKYSLIDFTWKNTHTFKEKLKIFIIFDL